MCGHYTWSSQRQDDSNAQIRVVLAGNTTFGAKPVTFEMRYTPPAGGPASYPGQTVGSGTRDGSKWATYSMAFPITTSENGGAVVVTARADGVAATCASHPIRIQCCYDSSPAGA